MKTILTALCILLLCTAINAWSSVTVTCDDCTFTPVYSYLVTENTIPVREVEVFGDTEIVITKYPEDELSTVVNVTLDEGGGMVSSSTTTVPIDPVQSLIGQLRTLWIEGVNRQETTKSFKEWLIEHLEGE